MELIWLAFLSGLTSGGVACAALQGGLLASLTANSQKAEEEAEEAYEPLETSKKQITTVSIFEITALFLTAKLIAHILFGGLLGQLGSVLTLSLPVRMFFQIATNLFLLATAAHILELHPIFRFAALQPPRSWFSWVRGGSKRWEGRAAPILLGIATLLIPCGVTQTMELQAINTGSPLLGAGILGAFVLGTIPLFALLGGTAGLAVSSRFPRLQAQLTTVSAGVLIAIALWGLNGAMLVLGSPLTLQSLVRTTSVLGEPPAWYGQDTNAGTRVENGVQKITITIQNNGYSPKRVQVKKGIPVELTLQSDNVFSCASGFLLRKFGLQAQLQPTDRQLLTFVPDEVGEWPYTCTMGMYSGILEVTE